MRCMGYIPEPEVVGSPLFLVELERSAVQQPAPSLQVPHLSRLGAPPVV